MTKSTLRTDEDYYMGIFNSFYCDLCNPWTKGKREIKRIERKGEGNM